MGLECDRSSGLPGVEQLLSRLESPRERRSLSPGAWCAAVIALCLKESAAREGQVLLAAPEAFADFVQIVPPAQRLDALSRLSSFVAARRGQDWRALLVFSLGEKMMPMLCAYAAQLAVLNSPEEAGFGTGVSEIARMFCAQSELSPAALGGVFDLADLRLFSCLSPLEDLSDERMVSLLDGLSCRLTVLSAAWLAEQAKRPALRESATRAFIRLAQCTQRVQDKVQSLPSWRVTGTSSAVLHEYELREYVERIRPSLVPTLSEEQFFRIVRACGG